MRPRTSTSIPSNATLDEIVAGLTQPQLWAAGMALAGVALFAGARGAARAIDPPQPAPA